MKKGPKGSGPGARGNVCKKGKALNPNKPGRPIKAVKPGKSG